MRSRRLKTNPVTPTLLLALAVVLSAAPAFGQLEIIDLTSPNIIGDSNLNGQPDDGPRVFTIAAKACNRGANEVRDLFVRVGDGTTPGAFPTAVVPVGAPYLDEGFTLALLPGANPVRFEGKRNLATDECVAFYFPVSYSVVDSNGDALWGKSNTTADDLPFTFTIWASATDTVTAGSVSDTLPKTVTIRNEITANPNKVQPNPQGQTRYSLDFPPADPGMVNLAALPVVAGVPPAIAPGETITIYFELATFGNPNQGFDLDGSPGADFDLWFQPIGERYWDPTAFRLVKVQADLFGTNCRAGGPNGLRELHIDDLTGTQISVTGGPFGSDTDRPDGAWYIKDLDNENCSAWDANWYSYTFMAIAEGQSRISPYQEVASGSDNEKYNGDYCGDTFGTIVADADFDTPHLICVPLRSSGPPKIDLTKTVDQTLTTPGSTLTYTINFTNTGSNGIGSIDSGVQVVDAIPANSTYAAGSATCSLGATCVIGWSTDGGTTFTQAEPPAASVTHIRWSVNQTLAPAAMGSAGFQVVVDNPFTGTIWNTAQLRIDNGPFLIDASAHTGVGLGSVHLHLFVDDNLNGMVDATDSNGVQDAGEADLPDVDVIVTDSGAGMQTLTSDVNGDIWAIVPPGLTNFDVVEATLPPMYGLTTGNEPQDVTAIINTPVNATPMGYAPPLPDGSIGDRVWSDDNGDGMQDGGEPGLNGITVELQDGVCVPASTCPTQVTSGDGDYLFAMLPPGTYTVDVVDASVPGGHFLTTANDPTTVNLSPGEDIDTVDFGYEPINGAIGDFVWADIPNPDTAAPANGLQDPWEPGLGGIIVELQDGSCTPSVDCRTETTSSVGLYLFTDVPPGNYTVVVTNPPPNQTAPTPIPPGTHSVTLAQAEVRLDCDFGYAVPTANIGDFVWNDLNNNGIQDMGEPGIANVLVELQEFEIVITMGMNACTAGFDCAPCTPTVDCPTTTTDMNGMYLFNNGGAGYRPGQYRVVIDKTTAPTGFDFTTPDTVVVPLSGTDFLDADFGCAAPVGTVTKHLFLDLNGNGTQDVGEGDLAGVEVSVTDSAMATQMANTDASGNVSFTVPVGAFTCDVNDATLPPGLVLTTANDPHGGNVTAGSTVGENVGYQPRGTLTKHVYEDTNGNGIQDGAEPVLQNVTVNVTDSLGGMHSMMTNATGDVSFNVPAGVATCDVDEATVPPGLVLTTGNDPHSPNVPAGGTVGANVGYQPRGTITKHVFQDDNGNGVQDGAEPDIVGVDVTVTDIFGAMQTLATNATGDVSFTVPAGVTQCDVVDATVPPGLVLTTGNDPHAPTVPPGGMVGANVGYQPQGTVTAHVFQDTNSNGVQDMGEPNLVGVDVTVTDSQGGMQTLPTDGNGDVSATVPAGNTQCDVVDATVPAGFTLTTNNDPPGGVQQVIVAVVNTTVPFVDYGYAPPPGGQIGDLVWQDDDGNGAFDVGEPGIPGVLVELQDGVCTPNVDCPSMVTNAGGGYLFTGLPPGNYTVVVVSGIPAGFTQTTVIPPAMVNLALNQVYLVADFGYQPPPAIVIAHVFEDTNGNGVQDGGEPDLAGVDVKVTDSLGGMQTMTTNATGDVSATVPPGNTNCDVVDATVPAGFVLSTNNDPPTGPLQTIVAVSGSTVPFIDYGYQPPPPPNAAIGLTKQVTSVTAVGSDQYDVALALGVENFGNVALSDVQVTDDLTMTFPAPVTFTVVAGPATTGTLAANAAFDGAGDVHLLVAAGSSLAVGASGTITFTVRITPNGDTGPWFNTAVTTAMTPTDGIVGDTSDDASDPDEDGNGNPDEPGNNDPTVIELILNPLDIPTVSEWGLSLLSLLLAALAMRHLRRRRLA